MNWFSLWAMARGRVAAALVAAIVFVLTQIGVVALTPEDMVEVQNLASGLSWFFGTATYGLFHIWREKKKLDRGEIVPSRVESLDRFAGLHPGVAKPIDQTRPSALPDRGSGL